MKKIIKIMLISSLAVFLLACGNKDKEKNKNIKEVVKKAVKVESIEYREVQSSSSFSATLEPNARVNYSLKKGGTAKKIFKNNGAKVKSGDKIIFFENEDLKADFLKAKANLESSRFQYKLAKEKYEKFTSLYKKQLISYLEFSNYESAYISSKENLNSAQAYYESVKTLYNDLTVRATINGIVGDLFVKVENKISANENVCTVLNDNIMQIYVSVPASIVSKLKLGEEVSLKVEDISKTYKGKITEINPIADKATKNFKIKVSIDNKNREIKDGMFATVTIEASPKKILAVPKASILVKELISYIFIDNNGVSKQVEVKTGISDNNYIEIISDELKEGDLVITDGLLGLKDNEDLKIENKKEAK